MSWAKKQDCIGTFSDPRLTGRIGVKPTLTALPRLVVDTLLMWQERAFERRALREMDDRMLKDIGVTALEAHKEACKPFWRA